MLDENIIELLKLAYETSKDKYDENGIPEAYYALNAFSNLRNIDCSPVLLLMYHIIKNSDYTYEDLKKFEGSYVYPEDKNQRALKVIFDDKYEKEFDYLSAIKKNETARNLIITENHYKELLMDDYESEPFQKLQSQDDFLSSYLFSVLYWQPDNNDSDSSYKILYVYDCEENNVCYYDFGTKDYIGYSNDSFFTIPPWSLSKIKETISNCDFLDRLSYDEEQAESENEELKIVFHGYKDGDISTKHNRIVINGGILLNNNDAEVSKKALRLAKEVMLILEESIGYNPIIRECLYDTHSSYYDFFREDHADSVRQNHLVIDYCKKAKELCDLLDDVDYLKSNENSFEITNELLQKLMRLAK